MKVKSVDFVCYSVSDLERSVSFYKDIVGLKLDSKGESWAEFDIGNMSLVLGSWGQDTKNANRNNGIALAVDDVKAALDELKKKGIKIAGESWETPVCFGGTFEDPDGNKVYLHHRKDGTFG